MTAPLGQVAASTPALDAFFARRDEVVDALGGLSRIAAALGASSLRDRVDADLVRKLREDRFHLVVVGEFNHGKTTFVNALLGHGTLPVGVTPVLPVGVTPVLPVGVTPVLPVGVTPVLPVGVTPVLPVGVTPTTAAIHQIRWADAPEAFVVTANGHRRPLPFEEAKAFAVGGGASPEDVDHLEIGYPAPFLKERILLVDTPGVNDLSLQRADITYSYIPRADAVLFLLDAGQILKESERVFLSDKLLKASRDKIVFVVTKWDLLSPEEQREAMAYARAHLSTLVRDPVVFPVSGETALAGAHAESGIPELVAYLTKFLAEERGRILLDNALGEGLGVAQLLSKGVDARRRALRMNADQIDRRIAALEKDLAGQSSTIDQRRSQMREDIASIRMAASKDLERFVDDVCRRLPDVIESAKPGELKQFLPAFLEDAFKQWAEAEMREIAAKLEQVAEKTIALVREDAHEGAQRVAAVLGSDAGRLDVRVDTIKYDVGVVALMFGGVALMAINLMAGGVLAVAGPAIFAMFARNRIHEEFKRRAQELAPEVMRETARKVAPRLDAVVADFAQKLDAWVVGAGQELHLEVVEVLRAARDARALGGADEGQAMAELDRQAASLDEVTRRVAGLRGAP